MVLNCPKTLPIDEEMVLWPNLRERCFGEFEGLPTLFPALDELIIVRMRFLLDADGRHI